MLVEREPMIADSVIAMRRGIIRCPECNHQMYYAMVGTREDLLTELIFCNRCRVLLNMRRLEEFEIRSEVIELGLPIPDYWKSSVTKKLDYDDGWI